MDPTSSSGTTTGGPGKTRARIGILSVFAVFFVPLGVAVWLYMSGWQPTGTVNHGELILPPVDVAGIALVSVEGGQSEVPLLTGQWSVVLVPARICDEVCRVDLYNTRQVRLALGKDRGRVQRILLLPGPEADLEPDWREQHPDLSLALQPGAEALSQPGYVLVVDPLGNLMMRYPPGYESKGILEDLKRLLKLSEIG